MELLINNISLIEFKILEITISITQKAEKDENIKSDILQILIKNI